MKKIFLLLVIVFSGMLAMAQTETIIEIEGRRGPYLTNGFFDNMFISAAGGIQVYYGNTDTHGSFGKRIAPALDVSLGKWLTPSTGVRLQYSGLEAKGWTRGETPYSKGMLDDGYYKERFKTLNLHGDFLWNLSNAIGGYRSDRLWSFIPYVGFGWAHSWSNGSSKNEFAATVGLLNNIAISEAWAVNLEAKLMGVNNRFDLDGGTHRIEGMSTLTLGLTYNFGGRGFQRAADVVVAQDNSGYISEINDLQKQLNAANNANSRLKSEMAKQKPAPPQIINVYQTIVPDLAIFFDINKANITEKEMVNLSYIADLINKAKDKTFTLYASADKETGTPAYNQKLSQKRGDAVFKILTEKFGVDPSRLTIKAVGSSEQKFSGAQLNRVVVIENQAVK